MCSANCKHNEYDPSVRCEGQSPNVVFRYREEWGWRVIVMEKDFNLVHVVDNARL